MVDALAGSSPSRTFSWTEKGGMVDLGTLGGTSGAAFAVNDRGEAVGESTTWGNDDHAVVWRLNHGNS